MTGADKGPSRSQLLQSPCISTKCSGAVHVNSHKPEIFDEFYFTTVILTFYIIRKQNNILQSNDVRLQNQTKG